MVDAANQPRRVLMTADAVGGVWEYSLDLARALVRRGVATTLAVMGGSPDPGRRAAARTVPGLDLRCAELRLEWMANGAADLERAADWLLALERETAPDVVQINGYAHAALPWRAPVAVVGHSCVLSWWRAVHGAEAPPEWDAYAARVAAGLAAADLVVVPTRAMGAALGRHYGTPPRVRVIPNGRDPAAYAPRPKEPFVLTAGRLWDAAKNVAALASVAPLLGWPVRAAGPWRRPDGTGRPPDGVELLGALPAAELAAWYGRAAVFALPARYEPFGLSVLEAALSGCALVLGDIASLRELWDGDALFVALDDRDALAGALARLIGDPALRADLGARARRRGLGYTAERMGAAYHAAYAELPAAAARATV